MKAWQPPRRPKNRKPTKRPRRYDDFELFCAAQSGQPLPAENWYVVHGYVSNAKKKKRKKKV